MPFSHRHNCVKSKPTDVNATTLRSPTAKRLYIWEALMCDRNILPSKATTYTRTSKAISTTRAEMHAHGHHYKIFCNVFLNECNHCAGRSGTRGHSPSSQQINYCFKWTVQEHTSFPSNSFNVVIHASTRRYFIPQASGEGTKGRNSAWELCEGLLSPSCPPDRAASSCIGRKKPSSKFGTISNYQLKALSLSSREGGWG